MMSESELLEAVDSVRDCDPDPEEFDFVKTDDCLFGDVTGTGETLLEANRDFKENNELLFSDKTDSFDNNVPIDFLETEKTSEVETNGAVDDFPFNGVNENPEEETCPTEGDENSKPTENLVSVEETSNAILETEETTVSEESGEASLTADDIYYQQIDPDELSYYKDHNAKLDLRCLVCSKQVNSAAALSRHPFLGVSACIKCCDFLLRDGWTKDDAGCDQQCRWCGQGGNILLCDNCTSSLCEGCLFKNLGRKYLRDAKTTDNWKCLLCDPSPILKHRADHYAVYKLQLAMKSKKKIQEVKKDQQGGETDDKFDKEVALKLLDGIFKTDINDTLEKLKIALNEEKDYSYENIDSMNIESLKTATKNVRKVLSNFESFFNAERIRIGKLFNRSFPNNKISSFSDVKPPVNKKEPEVKKKPQKSRVPLKKKKARPIVRKKNSMPVVALKPKKKAQKAVEKISIKRPPPKSKDEVKSQEPISRKRKASPLKTPAPAKVARTSSRGRKSESSPTPKNTPTRTSAREKRANDSTDLKSPSRSPSPPPRQSKSFVTPATKKAFPDTQASRPSPIIPSLSGIMSQFTSDGNKSSDDFDSLRPKPKIGPKSKVQKTESDDKEPANDTLPKKKVGPKSRVSKDN